MMSGGGRVLTALQMRRNGDSWPVIAVSLGYKSAQSARNTVYLHCLSQDIEFPRLVNAGPRPKPPEEWEHGSYSTYSNHKCRCDECKAAWAAFCRDQKAKRQARETPSHVHGTENGYGNYGCRCEACTAAWTVGTNARDARRRERNGGLRH